MYVRVRARFRLVIEPFSLRTMPFLQSVVFAAVTADAGNPHSGSFAENFAVA